MKFETFFKNGEILSIEQATAKLDDTAFTYGYGVYEALKIRNNVIYFPELHTQRLLKSASIIELKHDLTENKILEYLNQFKKTIKEESYNFKILLIGNKENNADFYILALAPLYPSANYYTQGVKTITYNGERQFVQAKTLNMLMSYLAYKKAKEQNAYDAILIDNQGNIREGTRTNLLYIIDGQIYTPPIKTVLAGVTLITLRVALKEKNLTIIEKELKKDELENCEIVMLTSTSAKVIPVTQINELKFEITQLTKNIIEIYDNYLVDYKNKHIKA